MIVSLKYENLNIQITNLNYMDTILHIKKIILNAFAHPIERQIILYGNKETDNDNSMNDLCNNCQNVELVLKLQSYIKIGIKPIIGNNIILDVLPSDSIIKIKNLIYQRLGINIRKQQLIYKEMILEDNNIISKDYDIKHGDILQLMINMKTTTK